MDDCECACRFALHAFDSIHCIYGWLEYLADWMSKHLAQTLSNSLFLRLVYVSILLVFFPALVCFQWRSFQNNTPIFVNKMLLFCYYFLFKSIYKLAMVLFIMQNLKSTNDTQFILYQNRSTFTNSVHVCWLFTVWLWNEFTFDDSSVKIARMHVFAGYSQTNKYFAFNWQMAEV